MKKTLLVAGILLGSSLLVSCGILPKEEEFQEAPIVKQYEGAGYGKTSVMRGDLTDSVDIAARYKGTVSNEVKSYGDLKVKKVYVKVGDKVEMGDLLIRYSIESYEKRLKETKYNMDKIRLEIKQQQELMKLDVEKQKKIGTGKEGIELTKEQYEATISSYKTQLKILQLEYEEIQSDIEENDGLSEIDGTVKEIAKGLVGSTPSDEDTLMVIEGKKKNRFEAKSKYADRYKTGDKVTLDVRGEEYEVTVEKPKGKDNMLYLYPVNKNLKFEDGIKGDLECVLNEKKSVLYLPSSTIFEMGDKHVVYVEDAEGIKVMKEIEVGISINHLTEIVSGLNEGDQVITS